MRIQAGVMNKRTVPANRTRKLEKLIIGLWNTLDGVEYNRWRNEGKDISELKSRHDMFDA